MDAIDKFDLGRGLKFECWAHDWTRLMTDAASDTPAYTGPRRVLSGIQASGALHLGNYLGALKRFTALQRRWAALSLFTICRNVDTSMKRRRFRRSECQHD